MKTVALKECVLHMAKCASKNMPVQSRFMERRFGVNGAAVRKAVRELRREGVPICSIGDSKNAWGGYFYSENKKDIEAMLSNFRNRVESMVNTMALFEQKYV